MHNNRKNGNFYILTFKKPIFTQLYFCLRKHTSECLSLIETLAKSYTEEINRNEKSN